MNMKYNSVCLWEVQTHQDFGTYIPGQGYTEQTKERMHTYGKSSVLNVAGNAVNELSTEIATPEHSIDSAKDSPAATE